MLKPDFTASRAGAEILRKKVAAYWAGRSLHSVRVWIEEDTVDGEPIYCVRSDMIGGFPRGRWEGKLIRAAA